MARDRPQLNWSVLYRSRLIWQLAGIYILFGFSYVVYATFFVDYLASEAGFQIRRAGSLWSAIGMLSLASGFIWGSDSDRLGRRYTLALVLLIQGSSYALFGLWLGAAAALFLSMGRAQEQGGSHEQERWAGVLSGQLV